MNRSPSLFDSADKQSSEVSEKRIAVPEIHHSDQGMQYLSKAYVTTLQAQGVEISVAHRGRSWENGYAERRIRTLKEEEVDINDYQSITEARVYCHR